MDFLTEVLPRLHETMQIDIPDNLMSKYIKLPLKTSIYLDKYEKGIRLELHFCMASMNLTVLRSL